MLICYCNADLRRRIRLQQPTSWGPLQTSCTLRPADFPSIVRSQQHRHLERGLMWTRSSRKLQSNEPDLEAAFLSQKSTEMLCCCVWTRCTAVQVQSMS